MDIKPIISIIIPVYNVEKYLEQCITSVVTQTYSNLEIILVDDGSRDFCTSICDKWAKEDERIIVVHKKNGGLADARNCGLQIAKGDFISFVDSDDWIDINTYQMFLDCMEEDYDIVCAPAYRVESNGKHILTFNYFGNETISGEEVTKKILTDEIGSQVVIGLYRKECWKGIKYPVGRLYEDMGTTYLVFANAKLVHFIDRPFYYYRINSDSISFSSNPVVPYHIFLGMYEHYIYAVSRFPDIADRCRTKALHFAISTYYHYCKEKEEKLKEASEIVTRFIDEQRNNRVIYNLMPLSRRIALYTYRVSPKLFRIICSII